MNEVLDVLLLRRPLLRYVSPPVCPVTMSGSGSGIMFEAVYGPTPPTGVRLEGQCNRFVTWDTYAGLVAMSLYGVPDSSQMFGGYTSLADGAPLWSVYVSSPGWWRATSVDSDGVETSPGADSYSAGAGWVSVQVPFVSDPARINLYKNPDPTDKAGDYELVLSTTSNGAFEVGNPTGCYRLQAITTEGASELSAPVCRDTLPGCCPPVPCPDLYSWDATQCSCTAGTLGTLGPNEKYCVGVAYASQFTAVGGTAPYNWELISGSPPPGLTFHTGLFLGTTAPVDGTPTVAGSYTFTIKVTDAPGLTATQAVTISGLGVNETLSGITDTPYSQQLTTGGGVAPYTFSIVSGSLPGGLSMTPAGLITGTPTVIATDAVTIRVTDSVGAFCDTVLSFSIDGCPTITGYPNVQWNGASSATSAGGAQAVFDSSRRNVLFMATFTYPHATSMEVVSTIAPPAFVIEVEGTNVYPQLPFGANQMAYDPIHDVILLVNQATQVGSFAFDLFNTTTNTFARTAVIPNLYLGSAGKIDQLACDTKRGRVLAVQSGVFNGAYEAIEPGQATVTILSTSAVFAGKFFDNAAYSDVADRFVIPVRGNNPPFLYVDPVTFTSAYSTINETANATSQMNRVFPLTGTPYVVFVRSDGDITVVNAASDAVYWNTGTGIIGSTFWGAVYDQCTDQMIIAGDTAVQRFGIAAKTYLGADSTTAYSSLIFDPAAGKTFGVTNNTNPFRVNTL